MPSSKSPRNRRPTIEPLEPRLLFSATADIAVLDDANSDTAYLINAAANTDLTHIYGQQESLLDNFRVSEEAAELVWNEPTSESPRELVFIDTRVDDYQALLDDIFQHKAPQDISVILLDAGSNGLSQMTSTLANYSGVLAVHVISHGTAGAVQLGNLTLNQHTLEQYQDELLLWRASLDETADLLIYGCNVAGNADGIQLLERLAELTRADIAASNDLTGQLRQGGNWAFEFNSGAIETSLVFSTALQENWNGLLADINHIHVAAGPHALAFSVSTHIGQSFIYDSAGPSYFVNQLSIQLMKDASAAEQTITVQLLDGWNGAVLGAATTSSNALSSTNFEWKTFDFTGVNLSDTQTYYLRISSDGSDGLVMASYHQEDRYNNAALIQNGVAQPNSWDLAFKVTHDDGSNATPTVANPIPNQTATERSFFSFTFPTTTFADADVGDTLTYSARLAGGDSLPPWLNFDAANRTFWGMPDNGDVGVITVEVTATDDHGARVTDNFDLTVINTNDDPIVVNPIGDQGATENIPFNFTFPINTFGDVDVGDQLTYIAQLSGGTPLPAWLSFDAATRTFSGTPTAANIGTLSIDVIADDGNGGTPARDTFNLVTYAAATSADIIYETSGATVDTTSIADGRDAYQSFAHFNGSGHYSVDHISVQLRKNPFANDQSPQIITISILDSLASTEPLAINTMSSTALADTLAWYSFDMSNLSLEYGKTYYIKVSATGTNSDPLVYVGIHDANVYENGEYFTHTRIAEPNRDLAFEVAGINNAPHVANPIPNQAATENAHFSFTFASNTFVDPDGDTLTYTAQLAGGGILPAWLSFNAATRTFSGTPANGDVGTISVEVIADDGQGSPVARDIFDIVIVNTNDAPTVAHPIPNQTATQGTAFNFTFAANTFNDVDVGDVLTYTAQLAGGGALPAWLNFDAATRTFTGTPANSDVGTVSIDVVASDGNGGAVTDTFNIQVNNVNDAPTVANPIPDQTATQDSAFNFTFAINTFNDIDVGDTLTYTAQLAGGGALPAWLSFNASTRTFSGTPANDDVGTVSIDVIANDGNGGTVTDTFNIQVNNINDAPTVANPIPDQTATQDVAFNFTFAADTFNDIDVGDTLTYTAQLAGGGALPAWLSFDAVTRTFSGTPTNDNVGTISIDVIADDGNGGTVTDTFNIQVANVNDAPTVANPIPDQTATQDSAFNFTFAINTFNDIDAGDTLTYTAQLAGGGTLPAWLNFDAATRTFSGTPTNDDVGTISIDVIADDGNGGTVTDTFNIQIDNVNDAPTIANPIPDQTATQDSAFNFTFAINTFNDIDVGDTLTYTAQLAGGGVLPAWLSFDAATRTFFGTPTNDDVGTVSIDVIADDGNGGTVTDTFNIQIDNVNDAPTVANPIPDQTATQDSAFNFTFAINTFNDIDAGDTLTYTAQLAGGGALPAWLSFDAATRTFSGTPTNGDVGTISIDVIASDGNGGTVTDTFNIQVNNVNDAPTVANPIPNQISTQDVAFNFTFAANTFNDIDVGDTLTYTAQLAGGGALPAWLSFNASTRTFSGTPTNDDVGTISIDVIADDGNGGTVTDTFNIQISNVNDAPTVANPIPDQTATQDVVFNFTFAANTFNDIDVGDTLTYSAQLTGGGVLPAWLSFNASTRTFSGTPTNGDVGTISIDVIASDGNGGTVTDTFNIQVNNVNDAPTVANPIPNQIATQDFAFNFTFAANTFNDIDVGDTLTYTAQLAGGGALPAWLSFDAATRTFSGTPTNDDVGTVSIDVIADDGNGGTVTDTFNIQIDNVNDAPTVANPIPDQLATEDVPFNFTFAANTFDDIDAGDTLSYTVQLSGGGALPAWLVFDAATRTFSGTATHLDTGTLSIDVIAQDTSGAFVSDSFELVVIRVNSAPTTTGIADITRDANSGNDAVNLFAAFDDEEDSDEQLTFAVINNSNSTLFADISINPLTGTLQLNYAADQAGSGVITVRATDRDGDSVETSFTVTILPINTAPFTTGLDNVAATTETPTTYVDLKNFFNDAEDGADLLYTVAANSNPALAQVVALDSSTGMLTLSFAGNTPGDTMVTIRATDSEGAWVETSFTIRIEAPVVNNPVEEPIEEEPEEPTEIPINPPVDTPIVRPIDTNEPPRNPGDDVVIDNPPLTNNPSPGGGGSVTTPDDQLSTDDRTSSDDDTASILVNNLGQAPIFLSPAEIAQGVDENDRNRPEWTDRQRTYNEQMRQAANPYGNLTGLISLESGYLNAQEVIDFNQEVDRARADMARVLEEEQQQQAVIAGVTLSITTGLLIWSLRASSLLLTLFSMLPLWKGIDPLPILDEVNKRKKELEQQRKDKAKEDRRAGEVGYLFDHRKDSGRG